MKVLLLENAQNKEEQLKEEMEGKKLEVISCRSSNDFLNAIEETEFDKIVMNQEFWDKGSSIYCYFNIGPKLKNTPLLVYNAEENFAALCDREKHEQDQILHKPVENSLIVEAAMQN
ncbi:hypothetical protein CHISP_2235 [Chitinispirillum alkaliphilum]|nr:hypothetical protein CHISP_2235 [Chitinispirillum alkaliphilum]